MSSLVLPLELLENKIDKEWDQGRNCEKKWMNRSIDRVRTNWDDVPLDSISSFVNGSFFGVFFLCSVTGFFISGCLFFSLFGLGVNIGRKFRSSSSSDESSLSRIRSDLSSTDAMMEKFRGVKMKCRK